MVNQFSPKQPRIYNVERRVSSINVLGKLYCSVQFSCSVMSDSTTPCTAPRQASPSIELVMPSNHLIVCRPLLLPPSIFPSVRSFQMSLFFLRWPEYWSFSLSISPSSEYSGLLSFRMNWLNLLAVQGTLKSLSPTPQFKSIPSLVLSFLYSPTLTSIHDYW